MKKILLGFIAIGLFTFVGCDKEDDDTETTDSTETSSDDGTTETTSGEIADSDTGNDGTDSDSGDGTTDDSSIKYGEGATDIDGNTYKSVIIGDQEWMAENLRTSKYSDGTAIPNVTDETEWYNDTTGAWCHYDNDNKYDTIYGKLYNWYAVNTSKLCPTGWHVPTDAEWYVLTDYLAANGHSGTEGTALKATSGWDDDGNGTDDYGWNGLPGGGCFGPGLFSSIGNYGNCWGSSQLSSYENDAWSRNLDFSSGYVNRHNNSKKNGFSVRCIRD